jgi:hypothetical protein
MNDDDLLRQFQQALEKLRTTLKVPANYENRIANVESTQRLHTWMLGFNLGLTLTLVAHAFLTSAK